MANVHLSRPELRSLREEQTIVKDASRVIRPWSKSGDGYARGRFAAPWRGEARDDELVRLMPVPRVARRAAGRIGFARTAPATPLAESDGSGAPQAWPGSHLISRVDQSTSGALMAAPSTQTSTAQSRGTALNAD